MKKLLVFTILSLVFSMFSLTCAIAVQKQTPEQERQGCCSSHNGVCGCSYGRVRCCDGSYSPSCGC